MSLPRIHFKPDSERLIVLSPEAYSLVTQHILGKSIIPGCKGIDTESEPMELVFQDPRTAFFARFQLDTLADLPTDMVGMEVRATYVQVSDSSK